MRPLLSLILIMAIAGCAQPVQSTSDTPAQAAAIETTNHDQPAAPALPVASGQSSLRLAIEGMHCSGCAASTDKRLRAVDGVADCSVSFETGQAIVVYDPRTTGAAALTAAVLAGTDYAVTPLP